MMETLTVKQIREKLGLTQLELATELHVGLATVYRWEKGSSKPTKHFQHEMQKFVERKMRELKARTAK